MKSTKDIIKTALNGKCQAEIMLNLNIMLSNFLATSFEAEIIILPLVTEAEMKIGVTDKEKIIPYEEGGAHLKISFSHLLLNLKNNCLLKNVRI